MTNESVKYIVFDQKDTKKKVGVLCWKVPLSGRFILQVPRVINISSPLTI